MANTANEKHTHKDNTVEFKAAPLKTCGSGHTCQPKKEAK